jgi:putative ABC transport system substrate-binding protein
MRTLGYVLGRDFTLIERTADGHDERLALLAEQIVQLRPDLVLTSSTNAAAALRKATSTIPIVFTNVSDPVRAGFTDTLAHPGSNMTGLSNFSGDLVQKRYELLKVFVPSLIRVAVLLNPRNPYFSSDATGPAFARDRYIVSAGKVGLQAFFVSAATEEDLRAAFQVMQTSSAQGLLVSPDPYYWAWRHQIARLALQYSMPTISAFTDNTQVGGLMSYGEEPSVAMQQAAAYVDKIFRGSKPGDLPIQQPATLELALNKKTAGALQLPIPQVLLLQADKVFE